MKELYPVRLNGVGLNAIDTRFHIADVEEEAPKIKVTTQSRAKYDGLRMMRRERETRRIIVHVVLWERDKMKRLEMYDKLVEWAESGGMLTLGYRNGQQIRVECTELPARSGPCGNERFNCRRTDGSREFTPARYGPAYVFGI